MSMPKKPNDSLQQAREMLRQMPYLSVETQKVKAMLEDSAAVKLQRLLHENSTLMAAHAEVDRAEEIRRLTNPRAGLLALLANEGQTQRAIATKLGLEGLSRIDKNSVTAKLFADMTRYGSVFEQYEASFLRPPISEVERIWSTLNSGAAAALAAQTIGDRFAPLGLAALITHPWMKATTAARSVSALAELHGIGTALRSADGFGESLTAALRANLGDWRDRITIPETMLEDPVARTEFYIARGFNTGLTDFPEKAFDESLHIVGLVVESTTEFEWPPELRATDPDEEQALRRTNECHDMLQRLERRLRQFIDAKMTAQYGAQWPKQLPQNMREAWEHKKSRIEASGGTVAADIEVADFTDYELIICRKNHWREVFAATFQRQESVRESFQRLYPIRLPTMHARFVTKEDMLYLAAESTRLLRAIGS